MKYLAMLAKKLLAACFRSKAGKFIQRGVISSSTYPPYDNNSFSYTYHAFLEYIYISVPIYKLANAYHEFIFCNMCF